MTIEGRHGDRTVCDVCEVDYTDSLATGGLKYGPHFYCWRCEEQHMPDLEAFGDLTKIEARAGAVQRFADFVRYQRRIALELCDGLLRPSLSSTLKAAIITLHVTAGLVLGNLTSQALGDDHDLTTTEVVNDFGGPA